MELKISLCCICKKEIPEHAPKFLIENKHADIPVSHFIVCEDCHEKDNK